MEKQIVYRTPIRGVTCGSARLIVTSECPLAKDVLLRNGSWVSEAFFKIYF
jgi:hypothetical protein